MSADFWAGYASGALGIVVGNPLDLIKVRTQASSSVTSNATLPRVSPNPQSFRDSLRGLPAPVLTYGALNALLFMTYNRSLALFTVYPPSSDGIEPRHGYPAHFLAGALAGLATFVISTPTELVKCRAQTVAETTSTPVSSWSIARRTLQVSGVAGLYEGGVITSIRDAVGYGFYFWTYEASKDLWERGSSRHGANLGSSWLNSGALKILMCGGAAGVATWASIFPLDVIKTRVQTQQRAIKSESSPYVGSTSSSQPTERDPLRSPEVRVQSVQPAKGAFRIAVEAFRTEGVAVFFRGMAVCCVRAFIVNAVQWATYEYVMRVATQTVNHE